MCEKKIINKGFISSVVLLDLVLQISFIHIILKNNHLFIEFIVIIDYTTQIGLLPLLLPGTHLYTIQ